MSQVPESTMRWRLRSILIIMTVGGGFAGFVLTLPFLWTQQARDISSYAIFGGFVALYLFVMLAGLGLAHSPFRTRPVIIAQILQIPWISTPIVTYRFTAGLHATVGVVGGRFGAMCRLGSDWQFGIFRDTPWGIGVNLVAVVMLILLAMSARVSAPPVATLASQSWGA